MIKAAFFEDGVAFTIMTGTVRQLNANTSPTRVWRQIDSAIELIEDVPDLEELEVHPGFVQRGV